GDDLPRRERPQADVQRDALAKLAQRGLRQLALELRLAREQDLQDLLGARLEVRQQAELLEHATVQILRLVDEDRGITPAAGVLEQELVQTLELDELPGPVRRDAELVQDVLQHLLELHGRVEDEDRLGGGGQRVEQVPEQGGLAGPDLADQRKEALALLHAVGERRHGLLDGGVAIEEAGV